MKDTVRIKFIFYFVFLAFLHASANDLVESRKYEWVVNRGQNYQSLYDTPIENIRMFAYHTDTDTWNLIPFQIDEISRVFEPYERETSFTTQNGILDALDEIVFMVRDLGDYADNSLWIDNTESQSNARIEIKISDPENSSQTAYGYLFASSTFSEPVPTPYGFIVDEENHRIETNQYIVGFDEETTLIKDIVIKEPYGTGVDIFDRQKFRFVGELLISLLNFQLDGATEEYFLSYPEEDAYSENSVVRVTHNSKLTIIDKALLGDVSFFNDPKFYPFGGQLSGGIELSEQIIQEKLGTSEDVKIQFEMLRQSWDFNEAAKGMQFSNAYNQSILVDGNDDHVNKKIDLPIEEWSLVTGDQGSVLLYLDLKDSTWQNVELYYHDSEVGGQADEAFHDAEETGDLKSFADHGIFFHNQAGDTVNLQLKFKAFFLEGNLSVEERDQAIQSFTNPVRISVSSTWLSAVEHAQSNILKQLKLYRNFPNPFNGTTRISFALQYTDLVEVSIIDVKGRNIRTLIHSHFNSGHHEIYWDGTDDSGRLASSGIYFVRLKTANNQKTMKITLMQ